MSPKRSQRWLDEHFSDNYVKAAKQAGFRSRAIYKLLEIEERDHLFKPGMIVVDLGSAPGGWSQLLVKLVKSEGKVIALDLLPMEPVVGVNFIQADFTQDDALAMLMDKLGKEKVDWVVSDMAPNLSGNASVDIPQSIYLAELAMDFALKVLRKSGGLLIKVFQGEDFDQLLRDMKKHFSSVVIRKPKASRNRSREVYLLARGLNKLNC